MSEQGQKFNPFRPNSIMSSGMFVGRIPEINGIEQALFQTKNGNPQHFLIQGERGIGKSSLLFLVDLIAAGRVAVAEGAKKLNFLTLSVDIGEAENQTDIVRSIARELKTVLGDRDTFKAKASGVWDFLSKWEILGVRYHRDADEDDPQEARDELVNRFVDLWENVADDLDGILILIDEADGPDESVGLGKFLKLFTERLTRKGCNNVLFGLAGLPSLIGKLRASHESSPRLFETFALEPLLADERKAVVKLGLKDAAKTNGFETMISEEALELISELSEGYPHFVQQFSYCAFSEDADNHIDADDVKSGAYKENGALQQLGSKYFNEMYFARISSEEYRRVLDAMAIHGDEWVTRKDIITASGVSEANVTNALASLKQKKIINQDDTRRGYYRLPTKSFAAWINATKSGAMPI